MTGEELYRIVEDYAALGDHRTGTQVDAATVDWFAAELRKIGAAVSRVPYDFSRYEARWQLRLDGLETPSLPLFYEGVGRVRTTSPAVAALTTRIDGTLDGLAKHTEAARRDGRAALVVATGSGEGRLVATNGARPPDHTLKRNVPSVALTCAQAAQPPSDLHVCVCMHWARLIVCGLLAD